MNRIVALVASAVVCVGASCDGRVKGRPRLREADVPEDAVLGPLAPVAEKLRRHCPDLSTIEHAPDPDAFLTKGLPTRVVSCLFHPRGFAVMLLSRLEPGTPPQAMLYEVTIDLHEQHVMPMPRRPTLGDAIELARDLLDPILTEEQDVSLTRMARRSWTEPRAYSFGVHGIAIGFNPPYFVDGSVPVSVYPITRHMFSPTTYPVMDGEFDDGGPPIIRR